MNTETELTLTLDAAQQAALRARIPTLFPKASPPELQELVSIYYDTPELDLAQRKMGLRLRQKGSQWIQTIKFGQQGAGGLTTRVELEHITHGQALELANIADLEVREFLCDARIAPRLQPTFATRIQRTLWLVEDRAGNLVELALDVGTVECEGRQLPVSEVEIELKRGSVDAVFVVAQALARKFVLLPQLRSKAERGYRLFQQTPAAPVNARNPQLNVAMTPWQARQLIFLECLRHLQHNLVEIGQGGDDMEFIHQARVAIRRMRSARQSFAALPIDPQWAHFEQALKNLAGLLGAVRDRDVLVRETMARLHQALGDRVPLQELAQHLIAQRHGCMDKVQQALRQPRLGLLLLELLQWLQQAEPLDVRQPKLRAFAAQALDKRVAAVEKLAKRWARLDEEQRHDLRKQVKKLRYAAEFFASLYPAGKVKKHLRGLQAIQEILGTMNDVAVCHQLLEQAAAELPATAFACGVVTGWHEQLSYTGISHAGQAIISLRHAEPFW